MSQSSAPRLLLRPLGVLLLAFQASCNTGLSDEDRLEIYSDSAIVHYEQGDLDRAQSQALRGLAIDSEHRPLNLMLGWILLRRDTRDDLLRAEQIFRRLEDDDDEDDRVELGLAMALERVGALHEEAALAVAAGTVETDADSVEEGTEELEEEAMDLWKESLELFDSILEKRPNHIKARNGAMRVSANLGKYHKSLGHCDTLISSVERDRTWWSDQLMTQDLSPSDEALLRTRVRDHAALLVDTHLFAASLLHSLGRGIEAIDHLDQVVELDPMLSQTYSQRAQLLAEAGRYSEAVADIDKFIGRSEMPHTHPDIRRAFDLRSEWSRSVRDELGR